MRGWAGKASPAVDAINTVGLPTAVVPVSTRAAPENVKAYVTATEATRHQQIVDAQSAVKTCRIALQAFDDFRALSCGAKASLRLPTGKVAFRSRPVGGPAGWAAWHDRSGDDGGISSRPLLSAADFSHTVAAKMGERPWTSG